jgi:phospholipase C
MPDQVPAVCAPIQSDIDNMKADRAEYERELRSEPDINKILLQNAIAKLNQQISSAEADLATCIVNNTPPPPPKIPAECNYIQVTIDGMNSDLAELKRDVGSKYVNQELLAKAIAKLDKQILDAKDALASCIANPPNTAPPATKPTISNDSSLKPVRKVISWDHLQKKMDEFFNHRTNPKEIIFNIRLHNHNHFTDNGEIDNDPPASDVTISIIEAVVANGQVITQYTPIAKPIDLGQLDHDYYFVDINSKAITVSLNPLQPEPIKITVYFECDGSTEVPTINHLLPDLDMEVFYITLKLSFDRVVDSSGSGKLEFLSWIDKIKNLKDDDFDNALKHYVVAHIESTRAIDLGGTFQGKMRQKIYDRLKDPGTRAKLNDMISRWILGGIGIYNVTSLVNDGQHLTIDYLVPAYKLDPFPDSLIRPVGWPFKKLPLPKKLKEIEHIVVLTMENRSFDHMLGYLSLPVNAGGMGRTDVDGLKGTESNSFENQNYPSFAHSAGDTAFPIDPAHSYEPVFGQINADLDGYKNAIPGTGKMDGFVKSMVIDKFSGAASTIMGHQPAENVPVYDALVRDFGISHRWFASHPGPTFCNRFYELTGRLNLASGLNADIPPIPADTWEFSNSSPLTPVFNKTIFDHLTDHGVTWKYYEHGYSFLRFFSEYTFDDINLVDATDTTKGFFTDAKNGTLPSVSFIDPHFIELPPGASADGPVADIRQGQDLVQRVVEAVVTGPKFENTLLIITYDEHGGFFDHVPPPAAVQFSDESPIKTYGIRVPAFFISPRVKAGSVFGHDQSEKSAALYFDHTTILKTIATRFMNANPPYMGARYAAAVDLSSVLEISPRKTQFLPFIRYNLFHLGYAMYLDIMGGISTGPVVGMFVKTNTDEQSFSFEQWGKHIYIRSHIGRMYITVNIPDGNTTQPPQGFGIKLDVKYDGHGDLKILNPEYQRWKFTPLNVPGEENLFIITNAHFPNKILQPQATGQNGAPLGLINKPPTLTASNAWRVTSPLLNP